MSDRVKKLFIKRSRLLVRSRIVISILASIPLLLNACFSASVYKFQSQPSEASVYYVNGSDKTLIGQTPIDYTKTNLPSDAPFSIIFEKSGFETREISVTPTDNSQTIISATLKSADQPFADATTKKIRETLRRVFEVQELTAKQKFVDALTALKKLEEENPNVAEIFSMKGSIYILLNDKAQAKEQWEKALKIDPSLDQLRARVKAISSNEKKDEKREVRP
jgi:tetratricopeptide (TPR) repeat protein